MAAIVWDDVVGIAPELAGTVISLSQQTDILLYVNTHLNVVGFGGEESVNLRLARKYLAAHMATFTRPGGGGSVRGQVTSETVGRISRTFSLTEGTQTGALALTTYGQQYDELVQGTIAFRGPFAS